MEKGRLREFTIPISLVLLAISIFVTIISLIYFFNLAVLPVQFSDFINFTGNYIYYIFALSVAGDLYFIYIFVSTLEARRKFEELMSTDSKLAFVNNVRELEKMAKKLGPTFRGRLNRKKEELKVKF
ncbi:MAG: DUF3198 domain-containing protein [Candidatus Thermoplasmatota archaeon]|jgi:hypothetical protein|nr:DUF3198 domain-containing protein [Candidatus Thermoplasmatota archaeon]MCL5680427.1 DUF3198 domain-containing protein [Candidatus Thermoplasmatota archaeon]